jgi:SAM-dependent methyltransferase
MDDSDFGEAYYLNDCGRPYQRDAHWTAFFGRIADDIVAGIRPCRVLDAGCAMGLLVEALRDRGVEAFGFDLSSHAITRVPERIREWCWQASVTDEIEGRYDLIVCQEVLPHLPLEDAERAVANLCRHADDVLFSVSPYPPAPLHANIAPPEHWAGVFASHGFFRDFHFDAGAITPWAVRYRRVNAPVTHVIADYERRLHECRVERDRMTMEGAMMTAQAERAVTARLQMESRVRDMERSWFWRARLLWLRLKVS